MANDKIQAIILAAGKSARFNTGSSKLVERICGKEMIVYTTTLLENMHINTVLVVGYKKELVQQTIAHHHPHTTFEFVPQTEQLGTGHALACSKSAWCKDHILVLNGDAPLLTQELLQNLIDTHLKNKAAVSFIVAPHVDPSVRGYGHVIQKGNIIKIIEDRHMNHEQLDWCNLNAGMYIFKKSFLLKHIDTLPRNKISGEYYLTDLMELASTNGLQVCTIDADFDTVRGVNTLKELWVAEHIKRSHLIEHWMSKGVRFSTPQHLHIDHDVSLAPGVYIGSGAQLLGKTSIGEHSFIGACTILQDANIGNNTKIRGHVIIKNSAVGNRCMINSFSYIHEKSTVHDNCTIESFSELNNQEITHNTKTSVGKKKDKIFMAAFKVTADQSFSEGA